MRIAMVGTRGIPAAYSGFETAVEHLARAVRRPGPRGDGLLPPPHDRAPRHATPGARLVHLPTVRSKHLDTLAHTLVSTAHLATRARPDVALYFIAGNAPVGAARAPGGDPGGAADRRARLGAREVVGPGEGLPAAGRSGSRPSAATVAVTDSAAVADLYERRTGRRIPWIPYGAEVPDPGDAGWCRRLGVEPGRFVLFVGRLVPENNAHLLVEAHRAMRAGWPLVVVGDAPYAEDYIAALKAGGRAGRASSPATCSETATASWCTAAGSCACRPRWAARTR